MNQFEDLLIAPDDDPVKRANMFPPTLMPRPYAKFRPGVPKLHWPLECLKEYWRVISPHAPPLMDKEIFWHKKVALANHQLLYPGRRKKTDPPKPPMLVGPSKTQIEYILTAAKDGLYKKLTQTNFKPNQPTQRTHTPTHNDISELEEWLNAADQEDFDHQFTQQE
jgi:hypothetical protein